MENCSFLLFGKQLEGGPLFISPYCRLRDALGISAALSIAGEIGRGGQHGHMASVSREELAQSREDLESKGVDSPWTESNV